MWKGYDKQVIHDVCHNCDSPVSKKSSSYIEYMHHCLPEDKVFCECYGDRGFFFATKAKGHARLIEIAMSTKYKGQGLGKRLLYRLLSRMKAEGLYKLTFRTPIDEPAQDFWVHMGARIVGLKDNDYEMEIKFK